MWTFHQCPGGSAALWDCTGVCLQGKAQQSRMPDLGRILSQANNFLASDDIYTHFDVHVFAWHHELLSVYQGGRR